MISNIAQPQKTYALVVGIETYDPDIQLSELDGPAHDAWKFIYWLLKMEVPAANIFLHLSPLEQNKTLNAQISIAIKPATRTEIRETITDILPQKDGDLLYVFWGGHGVLTLRDDYRLYYADAGLLDKKNLDLTSLLWFLKSNDITSFPKQVFIIDACANYQEDIRLALPDDTFTPHLHQAPVISHEQFVLFATQPGEHAQNSTERHTGHLSEVVLRELMQEQNNHWPPSMEQVTARVVEEFTRLRRENLSHQTPTYFWCQDWMNNKRLISQFDTHKISIQPIRSQSHKYSHNALFPLVEKLLDCPYIQDLEARQVIIGGLSPQIARSIRHHSDDQIHVTRIVKACFNYEGGVEELIHILQYYEKDSLPMLEVKEFIKSSLLDT